MRAWTVLLIATVSTAALAKDVEIVIAARDLPAGTQVTWDDVKKVTMPEKLVSASIVKADSAMYIVEQTLQMPVLKGDLLLWAQFETTRGLNAEACRKAVQGPDAAAAQIARARQATIHASAAKRH